MSTLLQLVNQAKLEIGVEGAALTTVAGHTGMPAKLVNWTIETDYFIQSMNFDWDFLWTQFTENTVAGDPDHSKPADLSIWDRESFWIDYTTDEAIQLNVEEYRAYRDSMRSGVKVNDTPTTIIVLPTKNLKLEPPPDAVYSLTADYWKKPVKMSADSDEPLIPVQYERIIIARVKMYFAEEQEVPGLYQIAQVEYDALLDRLTAHELPEQERRHQAEAPLFEVRPA